MTAESRPLRSMPVALSLATFEPIAYLACLALALLVPDRGLHAPWLRFFPGFAWAWHGIALGFVESLIYGFVAGAIFAPIYNSYNARF